MTLVNANWGFPKVDHITILEEWDEISFSIDWKQFAKDTYFHG